MFIGSREPPTARSWGWGPGRALGSVQLRRPRPAGLGFLALSAPSGRVVGGFAVETHAHRGKYRGTCYLASGCRAPAPTRARGSAGEESARRAGLAGGRAAAPGEGRRPARRAPRGRRDLRPPGVAAGAGSAPSRPQSRELLRPLAGPRLAGKVGRGLGSARGGRGLGSGAGGASSAGLAPHPASCPRRSLPGSQPRAEPPVLSRGPWAAAADLLRVAPAGPLLERRWPAGR